MPQCVSLDMSTDHVRHSLDTRARRKAGLSRQRDGPQQELLCSRGHRQYLEDHEDYLKGIAALERREPTVTLEELERQLAR